MYSSRITLFLLAIFLFSTLAFAQDPTPTPPPPLSGDDGEVVKITTTLVQLDVVVTDKKGNQVTDLSPEDFEILVNGEKQEITNFSYIFSKSSKPNEPGEDTGKVAGNYSIPPPPSKLKLENVQRTYAVVVDDLGISFQNISYVRQTLRKFINEQMEDGDLVAIVRTGSGVGTLQSFTSNKDQLLAAVEKIRWNPQGRGGIWNFDPIETTLREDLETRVDSAGNARSVLGFEEEKEFARQIDQFRTENFSIGTLGAMSYIIRGMRGLPGRKSVMFISQGFQSIITRDGITEPNRVFDGLRSLADLANRSSVVIYTLDPRGLQNPLMANAEDVISGSSLSKNSFDTDPREARNARFRDSQQTLRYLAYETGGFPFVNQNDLKKGLREAVEDQSGYYLLGYQPDSDTFNPQKNKFNKVKISVNRNDLKVRYRSGFFAVPDKEVKSTTVAKTPGQQIYGALLSPFGSSDISLSLHTLFAEDPQEGIFIRSLITIDANDLKFEKKPDGLFKANFDILAVTFGDNGAPIDETAKNYTISVDKKTYQKILEKGFFYNLVVPLKKAGAYQFRVALRDSATAKVGSASQFIEVPNLKKKRLELSSIILNNYTLDQWQKVSTGKTTQKDSAAVDTNNAFRQFKRGTVLRYDYIVYNAKTNPSDLQVRARLFRNGELLIEGNPSSIDTKRQTDPKRIETAGAITLGNNLEPGEYVLQVIVTDKRAKRKHRIASRWIDFEIVE